MKKIIFIIFIIALHSCGHHKNEVTYFGGQIVNPKSDQVILFKNDIPIDTAYLDVNNHFLFKFKDFNSGLYYFYNYPENQYIIIEKGDSLLLRLNTIDFDESLVFTGIGAKKNNLMISQFLENEKDGEIIQKHYYVLPPKEFRKKMDSVYQLRKNRLESFLKTEDESSVAEEILTNQMNLNLYRYLEIYPYMHHKLDKKADFSFFNKKYYKFRDNIDINDKELSHFFPLLKYLKAFSADEAYKEVAKHYPNLTAPQILQTFDYHSAKLTILEKYVSQKDTKDNIFRNSAYMFFLDEKRDSKHDEEYMDLFKKYSGDNVYLGEIEDIYNNLQDLKKGNRLKDNVELIDINGQKISLVEINDQKLTVYYFWAYNQKNHFHNLLQRVNVLKDHYPKVHFVGVNKDLTQGEWIKTLNQYHLKDKNQFRMEDYDSISKKLVINKMNKVIVINNDGTIIDAFADIYDRNFENLLDSYRGKNFGENVTAQK